jgi:chemotaxis protein MotA
MDYVTIIGIIVALGAIMGGQVLEGGHVGSLLQLTAFVIVIGGTLGAIMIQFPMRVFLQGMKMLRWIIVPPKQSPRQLIADITAWSQMARKGGLLSLEPIITDIADPFTRKGLQMLVDGAEPEYLRSAMEVEIAAFQEHYSECAKVWQAAGGYAPTIGILGAVMGLIHVMENLTDPSKLGSGIAVAFVATIYGVGSANLFFLPISSKLRNLVSQDAVLKEMLIEGLVSIANGENPRMIETKLEGFIV